jgi:prepilin-type N-terminal cleavage/methylation domain-containing protein
VKRSTIARHVRSQGGYTLVEVIITMALGVMLMTGLTSVVFTATRAAGFASSRVEASAEIRNFENFAYEDFAASANPILGTCGTPSNPCTTQPLVMSGTRATSSSPPVGTSFTVTYTWDGSGVLVRQQDAYPSTEMGTDVTAFSWYVDTTSPFPTVVVGMSVTVQAYTESQTFRFYPRQNP